MVIEIPNEDVPFIVKALNHYDAYTRTTEWEHPCYQATAELLLGIQRKPPAREDRQLALFELDEAVG